MAQAMLTRAPAGSVVSFMLPNWHEAAVLYLAATLAGMLRYFDALRSPVLQDKEMLAADAQHVLGAGGAVIVSTYHKAKGLEWPVVVLAELDRKERGHAFDEARIGPTNLGDQASGELIVGDSADSLRAAPCLAQQLILIAQQKSGLAQSTTEQSLL